MTQMAERGGEAPDLTELAAAITGRDVDRAEVILRDHPAIRGALNDPMPGGHFGATPLLAAIRSGDRAMVDVLLRHGADINQKSHWWAGGFGVLDAEHLMVDHLISRGAAVDAYAAARHGMLDRLRELLKANPERARMRGGDGQTPLHVAASVAIADLLLARGADIDALDVDHESTPAQYLVRRGQDVVRYLISRGARTDILMASALGEMGLVRRHLDTDPSSVRTSVSERWFPMRDPRAGGHIYIWELGSYATPLSVAREFGHQEVFDLLLTRTPSDLKLAQACELGDEELMRAVLASEPDLAKSLGDEDRRRLVDAAQNDNGNGVRLMLAAGWPVDGRGALGATALHWASWHGNAAAVGELLAHGAVVSAKDTEHDTEPLGWAMHGSLNSWRRHSGDYAAVIRLLLAAGARAPSVTDALQASEPVREALRQSS